MITKGYGLFAKEYGDYARNFRLCQPLESGGDVCESVPSFWRCANKMMDYLLDLAGHPKGRGIRPHSF